MTFDKAWIAAVALVTALVHRVGQIEWDDVWAIVLKEMASIEMTSTPGSGAKKKAVVLDAVLAFIATKVKLDPVTKTIIRVVVGRVIDAFVSMVNDKIGHGWVNVIEEYFPHAQAVLDMFKEDEPAAPKPVPVTGY